MKLGEKLHPEIKEAIQHLPVHVSRPLYELYKTNLYFKKLHLISDILLGFLRLYGYALIRYIENQGFLNESLNQPIETLKSKDSHGLWSTTIAKMLQEIEISGKCSISPEFLSVFGVSMQSRKIKSIKRLTVKNIVIDGRGKKQTFEVTNTPLELLINFRNKYVGHGTVYSEEESINLFQVYEPVLRLFIESLNSIKDFSFSGSTDDVSVNGYNTACHGSIKVVFNSTNYIIDFQPQLTIEPYEENDFQESTVIKRDDQDIRIIETYPYFIAHPYKRAIEETDGFKRLHLLKEVFLNYLKYLGLLTASEYFNSSLKIGDINRAFKNFLYRPQFGHWNAFMRSSITALNENNHNWFIKELACYYENVETKPYAEYGETSIGKLIEFRNHYLGHSTVPSERKANILWQENFEVLKKLLVDMEFCRNYTIVSSDKTLSWRLMGDEISQVNLRNKLKSKVALLNVNNDELSLVPFFILPGEYFIKEVADRAKLMVYEQNTGSRIVFFSPESVHGETNNELVLEQLNLMIREKERQDAVSLKALDLLKWKSLINENNDATIQSLLYEKKVIKGVYQERQDAEVALRSWIGAKGGLFFLSAQAGSGKTNLLVEMNRQYNGMGLDTILLRGSRFRTPDIWDELCYRLNLTTDSHFGEASLLGYKQENPLMILIDGANENASSSTLFKSILEFLDQNKGGHIKIVLSWRVNTKSELPYVDERYESIVYSDAKESSREENLIARSCFWLKPLNKVEVEGAWNKYINDKQDKVKRRPNFTYEELTYHDRSLSDQLDNPLLLRLFLELNNGKGLPKSRGGFISIWSLYHEKIISQ